MNRPLIYIDTRERDPWTFSRFPVRLKRAALGEADYTNHSRSVLIERKSVSDLFHTLTRNEARFKRELARLSDHKGYIAIVVEGTPCSIRRGVWSSRANGGRVLEHFLRLCLEYRIAPVFCDHREEAERLAYCLLAGGGL